MRGKALFRTVCIWFILIVTVCFITCSRLNIPDYLKGRVGRFNYGVFDESEFGE